ncbi:HlyD family efflux transporter periplasmic adaptor subunit [Pectobacterium sp. FL60-S17]|uniref:HlyD family efflux transporter periplasmic adaptor subunit n=1 Tax=Pectobacterium quasiaquaticum TaxID=2774015 RepID=A0A9Q2EUF7_9GAMM|nr:HlyD family efflux transporter periplasmic adaptor subunit [Pectobacterium quasiaquaticum]MBE5203993.1 HlyD family efflux transporter periplasmic adaptor subunit [Pectobacterium quasiaquaticum]MBE5210549.1 HlyD family efflux transporter periplasmic adaptor subunit [Pectobacterium quasiaquaticum]MBE5221741.1 HlyD family efflux transporter periplasmic adaptor subunit [Pectobacterium quasiaquaticum]URG48559.1 HlyD family efflux transporter periplasmic adaptor subunit [Pectobacterium quasiaquati
MIRHRFLSRLRRRHYIIVSLIVACGVFMWLLTGRTGEQESVPQGQWLPIQPQRLENQLGLVGRIQAATQTTLAAPFEGVIREVLTREGQRVEQGQTLLVLDPGQIEIQLRQAQAELLKAQREVQSLKQWEQSAEVSRARRAVNSAQSTFSNTQANLRDTQALFERGIVARMEVDTLKQQIRTQEQDVIAAQEEYRTVLARANGEDRKIAEMELINAQVRHQALATQVERQTVKAPFSGFVVRPATPDNGKPVVIQPGLLVSQGAPLFGVIAQDRFQVATRVEETDLHQLQEGMVVNVSGDGFAGQTLTGKVTSIDMQADAAEMSGSGAYYDVVVSLDTPLADLRQHIRLGMSARLAIIVYCNEHGIAVPAQAVQTDENGRAYVVYRPTADKPSKKINVTLGKTVAQGVEISGLAAGEVQIP